VFCNFDIPKADPWTIKATGKQCLEHAYPDNGIRIRFAAGPGQEARGMLGVAMKMVVPIDKVVRIQPPRGRSSNSLTVPASVSRSTRSRPPEQKTWFKHKTGCSMASARNCAARISIQPIAVCG